MSDFESMFEQNIQTPSGVFVSEVEIMRFFTTLALLKLIKHTTIYDSFNLFITKLTLNATSRAI